MLITHNDTPSYIRIYSGIRSHKIKTKNPISPTVFVATNKIMDKRPMYIIERLTQSVCRLK